MPVWLENAYSRPFWRSFFGGGGKIGVKGTVLQFYPFRNAIIWD